MADKPAIPADMMKLNNSYGMEVDSENKAKTVRIWSFGQPHMMAFHVSDSAR
jgi:hypothetical protein